MEDPEVAVAATSEGTSKQDSYLENVRKQVERQMERIKDRPHLAEWLYELSGATIPHAVYVDPAVDPPLEEEYRRATSKLLPLRCELCGVEKLEAADECWNEGCACSPIFRGHFSGGAAEPTAGAGAEASVDAGVEAGAEVGAGAGGAAEKAAAEPGPAADQGQRAETNAAAGGEDETEATAASAAADAAAEVAAKVAADAEKAEGPTERDSVVKEQGEADAPPVVALAPSACLWVVPKLSHVNTYVSHAPVKVMEHSSRKREREEAEGDPPPVR